MIDEKKDDNYTHENNWITKPKTNKNFVRFVLEK